MAEAVFVELDGMTDERGKKIPADQILEPYMFQNKKTLKSWKRPDNFTMEDVITWSKNLAGPDDWEYSAFNCYTTGKTEYVWLRAVSWECVGVCLFCCSGRSGGILGFGGFAEYLSFSFYLR